MAGERIRSFLQEQGVDYEEHEHELVYTANEVAASEGVSGWLVAKPVLLWADGRLVMVVVPAPTSVDLGKAVELLGAPDVRLATEEEFGDAFPDCDLGAEPPFGNLYDMPTYVDRALTDDPFIVFRGGTHTTTLKVGMDDYLEAAAPQVVDIAAGPS
jgi:Ala-tRNA(Pro) deacylase